MLTLLLVTGAHLKGLAMEAGTDANCAKERKRHKDASLAEAQFEPIAVETLEKMYGGSTGVNRLLLVKATNETRETN